MVNEKCMWYIIDDRAIIYFNDISFEVVKREYYDNYDYYKENHCFIDFEWFC